MRGSPIGSITCSIKGPFVRASAGRGGDIYLSQTFYSTPANLHQIFNFLHKIVWNRDIYLSQTFHSTPANLQQIFNCLRNVAWSIDIYISQKFYSNLRQFFFNFLRKNARSIDIYLSQTFYNTANPHQVFNSF